MSEALPYIGAVIGAFTPVGAQGGWMIGSCCGKIELASSDRTLPGSPTIAALQDGGSVVDPERSR